MKPLLFSLFGLALLLPSSAAGQEPRAIIEKAMAAIGQKESAAGKGLSYTTEGKVFIQGQEFEFTGKTQRLLPDHLRQDVEVNIQGNVIRMQSAVTPQGGWMALNDSVNEMNETQLQAAVNDLYSFTVMGLVGLLKEGVTLSKAEAVEVGGKPTVAVKVAMRGKPDFTLFFDKDTHLLRKAEFRTIDAQSGAEVHQEVFVEEFKDLAGQKRFTKLRTLRDGDKYLEISIKGYEVHDKMDEKLFKMPD